jgi:O-antigen/teichoic acid export membrane protein
VVLIQQVKAPLSNRKVLGNTAILSGYYALEAVLLFILVLLFARFLTVADFGRLSFALSYSLLLVVADPSVNIVLIKLVSQDSGQLQRWASQGISLRIGMGIIVLAGAMLPFLFSPYLRLNAWLFVPIMLSEQVRGVSLTYCAIFRGLQVMILEPVVLGIERVVVFVLVIILLTQHRRTEWIGAAYLVGRVGSVMVAALLFRSRFTAISLGFPAQWRRILSEAYPLGVLTISERVNMNLIPTVLTLIRGEYLAGIFQSAFKIAMLPITVCGVLSGSLFPAMSAAVGDREQLEKLFFYGLRLVWHVLLPFAAITLVLSESTIGALFGARYLQAAPVLRVLVVYYLCASLVIFGYYLLVALSEQKFVMKLAIVNIVITVAAGIPLIYALGPLGAAIALGLSYSVIAAGYFRQITVHGFEIFRHRGEWVQGLAFLMTIVAGELVAHHWQINRWSAFLVAGSSLWLVYFAVLVGGRGLLPVETKLIKEAVAKVRGRVPSMPDAHSTLPPPPD